MSMSAIAPYPAIVRLMLDLVAGREHWFGPMVQRLCPTLSRHDPNVCSTISATERRAVPIRIDAVGILSLASDGAKVTIHHAVELGSKMTDRPNVRS